LPPANVKPMRRQIEPSLLVFPAWAVGARIELHGRARFYRMDDVGLNALTKMVNVALVALDQVGGSRIMA
jgi:hypothetical protein